MCCFYDRARGARWVVHAQLKPMLATTKFNNSKCRRRARSAYLFCKFPRSFLYFSLDTFLYFCLLCSDHRSLLLCK